MTTRRQISGPPVCGHRARPAPPADCRLKTLNTYGAAKPPLVDKKILKSLGYFEDTTANCLTYARKAKAAGKKIVGIFCEFTPRELIMAADAVPVCMCGGSDQTIPAAEEDLPANLCPLIKSSYGYAKLKANPFLEMADLVIAETTCDGKKKMFELLARHKKMYVLELPQKPDDPAAFNHWEIEIRKLKDYLEKEFGTRITNRKLAKAVGAMNMERQLRTAVAELAAGDVPLLSGLQVLSAKSLISGIPADFRMYERLITEARRERRQLQAIHKGKPRLLVTGVPMPHEAEKVMRIIEEAGGIVVAQESCTGLKPLDILVEEDGDLLRNIARKYFHLPCSVMTPNQRRFDLIDKLIGQYRPDAVIDLVWQGCHTYNIESLLLQKHVDKKHRLPYLKLETDYSPSDAAQLKVRIQALLEMASARQARRQSR